MEKTIADAILHYHANKLIKLNKQYLPENVNVNTFLKPNTPDSIREKANRYSNRTYDLWPEVKNQITYSLFFQVVDEEVENYLLGDIVFYIWTGESFKRRNVSFYKK